MEATIFTRAEAAAMLKVSKETIYRWEKSEFIRPAFHLKGRPRYSIDEIVRIATVREVETQTESK